MVAEIIVQAITEAVVIRGGCHVMITGGKTAGSLYLHRAEKSTLPLERIRLLFEV